MGKVKEKLKEAGKFCRKHWKVIAGVAAVGAVGAGLKKIQKNSFEEIEVPEVLENYDVQEITKWNDGDTEISAYVCGDDKPLTLVRDLGNVGEAFAVHVPGVSLDSKVQATYWIRD